MRHLRALALSAVLFSCATPLPKEPVMIQEGAKAPAFMAETDEGKTVSLSDFKGKIVVLYFFPKADTPG